MIFKISYQLSLKSFISSFPWVFRILKFKRWNFLLEFFYFTVLLSLQLINALQCWFSIFYVSTFVSVSFIKQFTSIYRHQNKKISVMFFILNPLMLVAGNIFMDSWNLRLHVGSMRWLPVPLFLSDIRRHSFPPIESLLALYSFLGIVVFFISIFLVNVWRWNWSAKFVESIERNVVEGLILSGFYEQSLVKFKRTNIMILLWDLDKWFIIWPTELFSNSSKCCFKWNNLYATNSFFF